MYEGDVMKFINILILFSFIFYFGCGTETDTESSNVNKTTTINTVGNSFTVNLPGIGDTQDDSIEVPNGRPIYAIFVSGYLRNREFDGLHFYNLAKFLMEQGAYVHYSWWNNLLAPYMERPLHDPFSSPGQLKFINNDSLGLIPAVIGPLTEKAAPGEDYQFQADAEALLKAIRDNNPQAAIIVVGHSFGGDSVARLGASTNIDIDLLAPIDPVGNRSCTWGNLLCNTFDQWTRFRATHEDTFWFPLRREFNSNIKYLYHRWQHESMPPMDVSCPVGPSAASPGLCHFPEWKYLFIHLEPRVLDIYSGSTNVQSAVVTSLFSDPLFGAVDGHGEIVGYQGLDLIAGESKPVAIRAQDWPKYDSDLRKSYLISWESDSNYLDNTGHAPLEPDRCMVSGDMIEIVRTAVNLQPVANAGLNQTVECSSPNGTPVTLDGSESTDSNAGDSLTFVWSGPFGTMTGETINTLLPTGTHIITLTVDDGNGKTDSDTVEVNVIDSTPPSLSVSLSPDTLWSPNHRLISITASILASDSCDANPDVKLISIISNEADNSFGDGSTINDIQGASFGTDDREFSLRAERTGMGTGRIYTIVYGAIDDSGNITDANAKVTVAHDRSTVSK